MPERGDSVSTEAVAAANSEDAPAGPVSMTISSKEGIGMVNAKVKKELRHLGAESADTIPAQDATEASESRATRRRSVRVNGQKHVA